MAGVAVIRCAAIRALAHGGQVLVSAAVRELAGEDLPPGASLRDLGVHRLRERGASRAPLPARAPRPAARVPAASIRGRAPPQPAAPAHQLRRARAGARRACGAARRRPSRHLDGRRRVGKDATGDRGRRHGRPDRRAMAPGWSTWPRCSIRSWSSRRSPASSACASGLTAICSTTSSSACASPSCCSCSTTASTSSRRALGWRRISCEAVRSSACWRRAASRWGSRASGCSAPVRCPFPRTATRLTRSPARRAVILFGDRAAAVLGGFELDARHGAGGGAGLPQAGRAAARDRAGGRAHGVAVAGRPGIAPGRLLRAADRRRADGTAAPANPRGDGRLELRPAERAPARAVRPAVGVRRRLDARRRRDGVRLRRPREPAMSPTTWRRWSTSRSSCATRRRADGRATACSRRSGSTGVTGCARRARRLPFAMPT